MKRLRKKGPGTRYIDGGTMLVFDTNGNLQSTNPGADQLVTDVDKITDEVGVRRTDKTSRRVNHIVVRDNVYRLNLTCDTVDGRTAQYQNYIWWRSGDAIRNFAYSYSVSADFPAFVQRGFDAMKPELVTSLNLAQTLIELRDMKRLVRLLSKWKVKLEHSMFKRQFSWKRLRKRVSSMDASEIHLNWSFGVAPFLSDVRKIHKLLENYEDQLQDFLSQRQVPNTRHYTEDMVTTTDTDVHYTSGNVRGTLKSAENIKRHATMTYVYDCEDFLANGRKFAALRDMFGLRATPSLAWELLPFSFVIDWFLRVGDWIESFEDPLIPITLEVIDFCASEKSDCRLEALQDFPATPGLGEQTQWVRNYKKYIRTVVLPEDLGDTFINRGQYGLNQLALSTSLVNVRRR